MDSINLVNLNLSIHIKNIIVKCIYVIAFCIIDVIIYGFLYEKYYQKLENKPWWLTWLFWEVPYQGEPLLPTYRTLVFFAEFYALGLMFFYFNNCMNIWENARNILGVLTASSFMIMEFGYYPLAGDWHLINKGGDFEMKNEDTYWLKRIWFAGHYIFENIEVGMITFKGFSSRKFKWAAAVALWILILTS